MAKNFDPRSMTPEQITRALERARTAGVKEVLRDLGVTDKAARKEAAKAIRAGELTLAKKDAQAATPPAGQGAAAAAAPTPPAAAPDHYARWRELHAVNRVQAASYYLDHRVAIEKIAFQKDQESK
ncbi:MAG: hypothetical protein ACHQWU_09090 [Gemmatimonadales bacterium]